MHAEPHARDERYGWLGADSDEEGRMNDWCDDIEMELELAAMLADPFDSYV